MANQHQLHSTQDLNKAKTKQYLKQVEQRKTLFLLLLYYSLVIAGIFGLFSWIFNLDSKILYPVLIVLLVIISIELFLFKGKIAYYDMKLRYFKLLYFKDKPCNCKALSERRIIDTYCSYAVFLNNQQYLILYRISKSKFKHTLLNTSVLEIICFIKQQDSPFYSDIIDYYYQQIYRKYEKKDRINKQIIIQFKTYNDISQKELEEIESIICYKEKDNYLITINAGYSLSNKQLYFLCSQQYAPNLYYQAGVDTIKRYLK